MLMKYLHTKKDRLKLLCATSQHIKKFYEYFLEKKKRKNKNIRPIFFRIFSLELKLLLSMTFETVQTYLIICRTLFLHFSRLLTHFIALVSLYTLWKQKTKDFLVFSGGWEGGGDQWHELCE